MIVVGITGGIGSGKSIVCGIFARLGIPVYNADDAAKNLYDKYPELIVRISTEISSDSVDKSGKINRKRLAEIVFADTSKLQLLNSMVHPMVAFDFQNWKETHQGYPYVLKEAAILFESNSDKVCDKIITVVSPVELRISRLRERDKRSKAEIEQIISTQISDEEKIRRSDFVIHNDEKQMLIPQVLKIHEALLKLSPAYLST